MYYLNLLQNQIGEFMRGGKREGAGRKGLGKTKIYRLPIAIEDQVLKLLSDYKAELNTKPDEKPRFENVTKSKEPIKPAFPRLNKDQLKRFQDWLIDNKFAKSKAETRYMTQTPKACKTTFLKYIHLTNEYLNGYIEDICELYIID